MHMGECNVCRVDYLAVRCDMLNCEHSESVERYEYSSAMKESDTQQAVKRQSGFDEA